MGVTVLCEQIGVLTCPHGAIPRGGRLMIMHGRSYDQTLASLKCRDGARRVFTHQAEIASTKRASGL